MKRLFFPVVLVAATICASASELTVTDKAGKKMGTATFSMSSGSGKLTHKFNMTLQQQGGTVTMNLTSVHTTTGDPLSSVMTMTANMQGNSMNSSVKVTHLGRKATVVTNAMGQSKTETSTAPGSVTDKSMTWMSGKIPAVGTSTTYYSFAPVTGKWSKTTTTYHGTRSVKLSKGTVTAHVLTQKSATETTKIYFTAKGDLLRLESNDFTASQ